MHSSLTPNSDMKAAIKKIGFHLPERVLDNEQLAAAANNWSAEKILLKTGISKRHVAGQDDCASDLAVAAVADLFADGAAKPEDIDYLLLCTQSPDYFLPTTACLLQNRLGLPTACGALDFNLGCSGFVYGLGIAKGLIESDQARNVMLITAETYSKFIHPSDRSVRTLFGDAAAATLVSGVESDVPLLGPFVYGTDGSGAENLIVPTGGMRRPVVANPDVLEDKDGNKRTINNLFMNGPEIFKFTLQTVPRTVSELLTASAKQPEEIDFYVFHQANQYMLEHLRKKLSIPPEKFCISMRECGNTVSSTIPLALHALSKENKLQPGHLVMLVGFGVGYSWGAALVRWVGGPPSCAASETNPPAFP